jgi:hypothetical protein
VFHCRDHYGSGVTCPWIFYDRTCACNSFPGYFTTPFQIGTWNFPCGFSDLSCTSRFMFHHLNPYRSGVKCPWLFYSRTYACKSFRSPKVGPLVMASITPASGCL